MPRLENWSIGSDSVDPYAAPELIAKALFGEVYDHPKFKDGKKIRTSSVVKVSGKTITTFSGSIYELGHVSPDYLNWLTDNNIAFDPDNPIKLKD